MNNDQILAQLLVDFAQKILARDELVTLANQTGAEAEDLRAKIAVRMNALRARPAQPTNDVAAIEPKE